MNSVKKLSDENKNDVAKWVWKNEWWVMSDEWWKLSDRNWVMIFCCPNRLLVSRSHLLVYFWLRNKLILQWKSLVTPKLSRTFFFYWSCVFFVSQTKKICVFIFFWWWVSLWKENVKFLCVCIKGINTLEKSTSRGCLFTYLFFFWENLEAVWLSNLITSFMF